MKICVRGWSLSWSKNNERESTPYLPIVSTVRRCNSPIDCVFVLLEMASHSSSGRGRWNRDRHAGHHRVQRRRRGVTVARGKRSLDGSVRRRMWRQAPRGGIRYVMTGHSFVHSSSSSSERTHRSTVMRRSTTIILKTETQSRLQSNSPIITIKGFKGLCKLYSKYRHVVITDYVYYCGTAAFWC